MDTSSKIQIHMKVCLYWWLLCTHCCTYFFSLVHSVRILLYIESRLWNGFILSLLDHWQQLYTLPITSTMLGSPILIHPSSQDLSTILLPLLKSDTSLNHQYWIPGYTLKISHLLFTKNSYSCDAPPSSVSFGYLKDCLSVMCSRNHLLLIYFMVMTTIQDKLHFYFYKYYRQLKTFQRDLTDILLWNYLLNEYFWSCNNWTFTVFHSYTSNRGQRFDFPLSWSFK